MSSDPTEPIGCGVTTGHPAGDAVLPAAERLVTAVRDGDRAEAQAAFAQAHADTPRGTDGLITLAYTLAAMVPDPRHTPTGVLLGWCQHDRDTQPSVTAGWLADRPGRTATVITAERGVRLVAQRDTSWSLIADLLVEVDDVLEALPPGVEKDVLGEHRDALFDTWRSLTRPATAPHRPMTDRVAEPTAATADHDVRRAA